MARLTLSDLRCKDCKGGTIDPPIFSRCLRCADHPGIDPDVIRISGVSQDSGHSWLAFDDLGWLADQEIIDAHYRKPYVVVPVTG